MKRIDQYDGDLRGKRVLVRADFNVPIEKGAVADDFRIRRSLKTLQYLRECGARTIVVSHIGRGGEASLKPIAADLKKHIPVTFVPDIIGTEAQIVVGEMHDGDIVLLENLRRHPEEKENDAAFSRSLASYADVYVNNAFAVSHRAHASIIGVPEFLPSYAGFLLADEIEHLSVALNPPSPSLCILGGAKFDTKEPLIRTLLTAYDRVFIGGALANDVFAACGYEVGRSLVSPIPPSDDVFQDGHLLVPTDVVAQKEDGRSRTAVAQDVEEDEKIVDIGLGSIDELEAYMHDATFVLWNGPMGVYEEGFDVSTLAIARVLAESTAQTIVGGGDTIAAIEELGLEEQFSFISTGGGAMLEFLLNSSLPGIDALK